MRTARSTLLAAAVAAAVVGGALAYDWSGATPAASPEPSPAPLADEADPAPAAGPSVVARPAPRAAVPPSAPQRPPHETLSAQVDRLARSPNPVDAFAAYKLVTACLWARDHEAWMDHHVSPGDRALLPTTESACGDIASDQVQDRLRWLERAALAGVHHAATAMAREGPDGLGLVAEHDLDAPQYATFRERLASAWDAGVRTCDTESLENREDAYENGNGVAQDRAKALSYWVAYTDCRRRLNATPSDILGNADSITQRMGSALTPEQIAAARSVGEQMARDAQPLPGDQ